MNYLKTKQRIGRLVGDYLTYNRTEQRGIMVLSLILAGVIIANAVIPSGTFQKSPDYSKFAAEISEFEIAWRKAVDSDSIARAHKYMNYRSRTGISGWDSLKSKGRLQEPPLLIELNAADTFDLQQLRGIGPGFARRIVNYREKLRGYNDKKQVLEVFGMDTSRYNPIAGNLLVNKDSVHPFDLNTVTFKELLRHPYFPFAVTKNIMLYRQKNKTFKIMDELRRVDGISDSLFRRMVIYLRLGP
jgi:DNA uptake protein ComE-like DNA-binding protein